MRDIRTITRPDRRLLTYYVLSSLVLGPCTLVFLPVYYLKFITLRYRFDDEGVAMSWGYFWRREVYLTYARIQDIHLSTGILERWLGLATIDVQTAAGSSMAEMSLVGIPEYEALRDFLYERMRGAKHLGPGRGAVRNAVGVGGLTDNAAGVDGEAVALLREIRDALRETREHLEAARQKQGG